MADIEPKNPSALVIISPFLLLKNPIKCGSYRDPQCSIMYAIIPKKSSVVQNLISIEKNTLTVVKHYVLNLTFM